MQAADAIERAFIVVALFFFSGAVIQVMFNPGGMSAVSTAGDPWSTRLQYFFYGGVGILTFAHRRTVLPGFFSSRALWLLVLLAVASTLWSSAPTLTLKSSVWLLAATWFGAFFSQRFDENEQLDLLAITLILIVLASLIFSLAIPDLGLEPGEARGSWRGAFTRKNGLGRAMSLGVVVFALNLRRPRLTRPIFALLIASCAVLIYMADSATAVMVSALMLVIQPALPLLRTRRFKLSTVVFGTLAASILTLALLWQLREPLLSVVGRDTRLTGRDTLWIVVIAKILVHPWIGYGHQAFWRGPRGDYLDVWQLVGWSPPHAHNGFLDTALELGLAGLLVLLVVLSTGLWGALKRLRAGEDGRDGIWPTAYLLFFVLINVSETSTLRHSNIYWILLATAMTNALRRFRPAVDAPVPAPASNSASDSTDFLR